MENYDLSEIQTLMSTGKGNLPESAQRVLFMLDTVRAMYQKYETKPIIINTLVRTYNITRERAGQVFADALNYFYLDHQVTKEAWRNIYAEKFENAAAVCWEENDMEGYRRNLLSAAEMRQLNKEDPPKVPDELLDRRTIIYINDPKKLGIPPISRSDLAAFIDKHDITEIEKDKLYQDAGIKDIEWEDAED